MNDGIGTIDVSAVSEAASSNESSRREEAGRQKKISFVKKWALKDQNVGPSTIISKLKETFGEGMEFYKVRELMETIRNKTKAAGQKKSNDAYNERVRWARNTLKKNPGMSHVDLNKLSVRRHELEISNATYQKYSVKPEKPKSFKEKVVSGVKASFKTGTSPLKAEQQKLSKLFIECEVKEATFTIVDGVPHWRTVRHVVEEI